MGTITYDLDQRPTSLKIIFIASTTDAALNLEQSNRFFSQFLMPTQNNSAAALLNILPLSGTFELVLLPTSIGTTGSARDSLYHLSWNNLHEFCCDLTAVVSSHVIG
jgi:hypothetical protein